MNCHTAFNHHHQAHISSPPHPQTWKNILQVATTHLIQILIVEQVRLPGLEAILAFAFIKDIRLKFPARVLFGRHVCPEGGGSELLSNILKERGDTLHTQPTLGCRTSSGGGKRQNHSSSICLKGERPTRHTHTHTNTHTDNPQVQGLFWGWKEIKSL